MVGPNADQVQFGDYSWTADNRYGITPLAGIRQYLQGKGVQVDYERGCDYYSPKADSIPHALRLAAQADLTIAVVGTQSSAVGARFATIYQWRRLRLVRTYPAWRATTTCG